MATGWISSQGTCQQPTSGHPVEARHVDTDIRTVESWGSLNLPVMVLSEFARARRTAGAATEGASSMRAPLAGVNGTHDCRKASSCQAVVYVRARKSGLMMGTRLMRQAWPGQRL